MIKDFYNTNVLAACKMLDVTDESIIAMSNGELSDQCLYDNDENLVTDKPTLASEKIFGELGAHNLKMGHIHLPVPIVNIQYFRGKKPILPSVLKMNRKDVESIIYCHTFVNTETDELSLQSEEHELCPNSCVTGAEAINYLLAKVDYPSESIILNNVPVIPSCLRADKDEDTAMFYQIEHLYDSLLYHCNRYRLFLSLSSTPAVIVQREKESIQKYADKLIFNGATDFPSTSVYGTPFESLQNFDEIIGDMNYNPVNPKNIISKYSNIEQRKMLADAIGKYVILNNKSYSPEDGKEYAVISKDDEEKLEELLNEVYSHSDLIAEQIFKDQFSDYADYENEFVKVTHLSVSPCVKYTGNIAEVDDELIDEIILGMYMQMMFSKKYRVQWLDAESED